MDSQSLQQNRTDRLVRLAFSDIDLPQILAQTGLSMAQIAEQAHVAKNLVYKVMGRGDAAGGRAGDWAVGISIRTMVKLMDLAGAQVKMVVMDKGAGTSMGVEDNGKLMLMGAQWEVLSPAMGPIKLGKILTVDSVASAFHLLSVKPEHWDNAQACDGPVAMANMVGKLPAWMKVKKWTDYARLMSAYYMLADGLPAFSEVLLATGHRQLVWEGKGRGSCEAWHKLGACRKCGVDGNLVGQVLMAIRAEMRGE